MAKPKLLVIDDEEDVLDMIRNHFEVRGFDVFTASDGTEGIEACRQSRPDVILLDLKMKKMDGDQAIPYLRDLVPEATLFIVSACEDEAMAKRTAHLKIDGYFEKPVSVLRLQEAVMKAVGKET